MRFAICNEMFQNWEVNDVFRLAAEIGYDGVELAPFTLADSVRDLSPERRREIRQQAEDAGISIVGLHWLLVSPKGLYITHPDEAIRKETAAYFVDLIHCCADLGGNRMILGSPKQRNLMEGVSHERGWQWTLDFLRSILPVAEAREVTLCFEPLAPAETNFIQTAEEAIRLVQGINSPNLKIILDVKAMSGENKPIPEIIRASGPWVAHFHANDANLRGPGFGDVDYAPIVAALRDIGYDGWVSVEVFDFSIDPEVTARRSLSYLKEVFGIASSH
ncbi:MAG TPA: sugar phosphate isomerase/epimerase family protein [Candidatus Latescibacteria bacterium]|nr:sugar phosphate isomerase/epimerase family protein [Candidatus Latescibacterota bacterium]HOS64184.1 sugar phosphate isomerase/epimerase family protein [Candidatus Latescibacterota bacterium]HPK74797.1 sugar phosphate isomerase/epimerase family protein [Candidatus Latescibacterota bacterium]